MSNYHNPVLLNESVEALIQNKNGIYVDCTFGGGGHSTEILNRLEEAAKLFSFDCDTDAKNNILTDKRFQLLPYNFRHLKKILKLNGVNQVNGILADLGVSSHQFDIGDRGFSIRFNGPLDMRMNQGATKTAATILNEYSEEKLAEIFKLYGEIKSAYRLAKTVVKHRQLSKLETTEDLMNIIGEIDANRSAKFSAKVFQAIRIEVNEELEVIKEMLMQAAQIVKTGGRIVIISYHSLEDRLVKNFIRYGQFIGEPERDVFGRYTVPFKAINKKIITPSQEEIKINNRARSAKMRIAEKI